jgi:transposase InsO family protein
VVNYRRPNQYTTEVHFPLMKLETLLSVVKGAKYFGKLDLSDGYFQLALDAESQEYYVFQAGPRLYKPLRLVPGSRNAAACFQAAMIAALGDYVDKICVVYMDDVLVFGKTATEFAQNWKLVLQRLHEHKLKVSAKKTTLYARELKYCGRILTPDGAKFDPQYVDTVLGMGKPLTLGELRSYLATANWLRAGIPRFAEVVEPLQEVLTAALRHARLYRVRQPNNLLLREVGWGPLADASFERIGVSIAQTVTLAFPDDAKATCVWTDASDKHWAGLVTQTEVCELEKPVAEQEHHPLAFLSGSFRDSSLNWATTEKEGYALVATMERCEHLVTRSHAVHVFTDHSNLTFLFDPTASGPCASKPASDRVERWRVIVGRFMYRIHHVPGEMHVAADMFSRWANPDFRRDPPEVVSGGTPPEEGPSVQPPEEGLRVRSATRRLPSLPADADAELLRLGPSDFPSESDIRHAQTRGLDAADKAMYDLSKDRMTELWLDPVGHVFVPDALSLRQRLCVLAHQGAAGHRGVDPTLRSLRERFTWPNMESDVRAFVRQCLHCLRVRGGRTIPRPWGDTLHANGPNQVLHFDYMYVRALEAASDHEYQYILVIMDGFTRLVELVPSASADARTAVNALLLWISRSGGAPRYFVSDQGTHFNNVVLKQLCDALGTHHHFTAVYAPWSNGRVERVNREIRELLTMLRLERQMSADKWPTLLPLVQSVLNNTPARVLGGYAPIEVTTGRKPTSTLDVVFLPEEGGVVRTPALPEEVRAKVESLQEHLHRIHEKVTTAMLTQRDRPREAALPVDFDVGDFVLYAQPGQTDKDKTRPLWFGPARVTSAEGPLLFTVQDIVTQRSRTLHATYLKRYADKDLTVTKELHEFAAHGGTGFFVDAIVGHRRRGTVWELLVSWEGYDESTWEPLSRLSSDVPQLVRKYVNSVENAAERRLLKDQLRRPLSG